MGEYMNVQKRFIIISNAEIDAVPKPQTKDATKALYLKSSKYTKNSITGDLMTSQEAKEDLLAFLNEDL